MKFVFVALLFILFLPFKTHAQVCDAPRVEVAPAVLIDHGRLLAPIADHLSETERTALLQDLTVLGCVREFTGSDRIHATVHYFPDIQMYGIVIEVFVHDAPTPTGRFEVYDRGYRLPRGPTIREASSDAVLHSAPYGANHAPIN